MRLSPAHPNQMREVMGAGNLASTADIKAADRAAKANYAAELQAQMRANEEAKLRERMERLGIGMPPPLQQPMPPGMGPGPGGPGSPPRGAYGGGGMGFGNMSPRMGGPGGFPPPPGFPPPGLPPGGPSFGSPRGGAGPPNPWGGPPPPPPFQPGPPAPPPFFQPPPYQPGPPMGGPFGLPSPNRSPPREPSFVGGSGYGPQPPAYGGSFGGPGPGGGYGGPPPGGGFGGMGGGFGGPPPGGGFGGPPPGGGFGGGYGPPPPGPPPLLPGPAPPPGAPGPDTMHRMEQQARKDQYRLELEAQIRDREERRVAEKARQREEDMRKEAEIAAYAAGGNNRGGGGAPHRDAAGNVVTNLAQMHRMGAQGPPSPGRMGPPGMGMGPPPPPMGGMGMGMGPPPPMGGMGMGMGGMGMGMGGMGMGPPPPMAGSPMGGPAMMPSPPPPMAGSPGGMMGGPMGGPMDGPPGVVPNYRFRSDNPYITPAELDSKQRQARELQEALEQQIAEKKRQKELQRQKEMEEDAREEARMRAGAEPQQNGGGGPGGGGGDGGGGGGPVKTREDVLADAWEKARLEAEELKRNKFAAKRGGGGGGVRVAVAWGDGDGQGQDSPGAAAQGGPAGPVQSSPGAQSRAGGGGGFGGGFGGQSPPPLAVRLDAAAGRPSTPLVVEKVRQVAAAELAAVKQELVAEAAQLREVVAAQGQQVAALKSHAERMEAEAERAREQVTAMRVGLLHRGGSVGADMVLAPPAPALVNIDLDLPPPGAILRRSAAPLPLYDMGPSLPGINSSAILLGNASAAPLNANPASSTDAANGRPSSVGLRTINPLEQSMAGESVFIYPNGKEMARYTNAAGAAAAGKGGGLPTPTVLSPSGGGGSGGGLPFQSLELAAGELPTVMTVQELNPAPVPMTPGGTALPSTRGPGPSGGGAIGVIGGLGGGSVAASKEEPLRGSAGGGGAALGTPIDVDLVINKNKEKLAALKGMTELSNGAASIEALDEFLARYAAQRPGLPERTATPVMRVNTPPIMGGSNGGPPMYSSRVNSVGPLPMGEGRVLSSTGRPHLGGGGLPDTPSSSLKLTRRKSFTGDKMPQEGVLSQCIVPESTSTPRPRTGPDSGSRGGGGGGRAANNRYSNSGKAGASSGSSNAPLTRSRSLTVPPPPEDTLDQEMRKGMGSTPTGGATGAGQGAQPSPPGLPKRPGSKGEPPFAIPRSPMLAGRVTRTNSASGSRPGSMLGC